MGTVSHEGALTASCSDPAGDAPSADLIRTTLVEHASGLDVTFRLASTPEDPQSLKLAVSMWTSTGVPVRQIAVHWSSADPDAYLYDVRSSQAIQVSTRPVITKTTESVLFPRRALRGLGAFWKWNAWSYEGTDAVDDCPQSHGGTPARVAFPASRVSRHGEA